MSILTQTNWLYTRYSETAGIETSPQPLFNPVSSDPGDGWTNFSYKDFNGNYQARDENNVPFTPAPYVPRDENNQIITPAPYVRHDEDNNVVPNPAPVPPPN